MKLYLVCGYRGTGKDTLYLALNGQSDVSWCVFANKNKCSDLLGLSLTTRFPGVPLLDKKLFRIAFADALKIEAAAIYGIPEVVEDKNMKQFIHYATGEMVSARDIYIEYGVKDDIYYWCKKALDDLIDADYMVTDWRLYKELDYSKRVTENIVTIRVYRSDVVEPAKHIVTEHELDDYMTDLLLLPLEDMVNSKPSEKIMEKFPQYKGYEFVQVI